MGIDLSSVIFRAHQTGDETYTPITPNGTGGIGINLQAIKFRAWQAPGVVVIVVGGGGGVDGGGGGVPIPGGGTTTVGVGTSPTGGAIANGAPSTTTSDNFNDGVLDPTIWNGTTETNGAITESTTLDFNLAPTGTDSNLLLTTLYNYSIYDSTWGFSVPFPGTTGTSWSFLFLGTNTGFRWNATTGTLTVVALDGTHDFVLGTAPTYYRVRHVPDTYSYPVVSSRLDTHGASNPVVANIPSGTIGDLLLILFSSPFQGITPTGWNRLAFSFDGSGGFYVYYRTATGTEGSTVSLSSNVSGPGAAYIYRIKGWRSIEGSVTSWGSINPVAPSLTPSWGAENTLWIIAATAYTSNAITAYPSSYTDNRTTDNSGGGNPITHVTATKNLNAANDPSSAFTAASANWDTSKIAIRPETPLGFGTYYYETSTDGITWTTRYSEQATSRPAEGKFQITATRTVGSGNDTVSFDNFYVIKNSPAPIIKITVPVVPATATGAGLAPTPLFPIQSPSAPAANATARASGIRRVNPTDLFPPAAEATASVSAPVISEANNEHRILTPSAEADAIAPLNRADATVYEVNANATASVATPTISHLDTEKRIIVYPAANAIAKSTQGYDNVTVRPGASEATGIIIRPQLPPIAVQTITSDVAIANASVTTPRRAENPTIFHTIAVATASVGTVRRPDRFIVHAAANATASVP